MLSGMVETWRARHPTEIDILQSEKANYKVVTGEWVGGSIMFSNWAQVIKQIGAHAIK